MFKRVLSILIIIAIIIILSFSLTTCDDKDGHIFYKTTEVTGYKSLGSTGNLEFSNTQDLIKVCQNDYLQIFYDSKTYNLSVFDRRSGKLYTVNPKEELSQKGNNRLAALNLVYADTQGKTGSVDSYTQSVELNQVEVITDDNSITFNYSIGDLTVGLEVTPSIISNKRFEDLLEKADASQKRTLKRRYGYVKDYDSWSRRKIANPNAIAELVAIFNDLGYTDKDLEIDNSENNVSTTVEEKIFFKVPLTFTLDTDSVVASVDLSKVEYPKSKPLVNIEFLQFFGAAKANESGYFLLPDGSGAIMPFNTVESGAQHYEAAIYGDDNALRRKVSSSQKQDAILPVFGAKYSDGGFLAVIEDGDALADVFAYNSGSTDEYNKVYSRINFLKTESVSLGNQASSDNFNYYNFQEENYNGKYSIRYIFLEKDKNDYSFMAQSYRNYLITTNQLETKKISEDSPLVLETVGGILTDKSFLGFNYKGITALTEYGDNIKMAETLTSGGVKNLKIRLTAYNGDGLQNSLLNNIKLIGELGGEKGLQNLVSKSKKLKFDVYPDFKYLTFSQSDGIVAKTGYAIKSMDSKAVSYEIINKATLEKNQQISDNLYYLTAIGKLDEINNETKKHLAEFKFKGASIADMAKSVSSDFTPSQAYDRQSASNYTSNIIRDLTSEYDLMLNSPNARNINYALLVTEAPLWSSQYSFTEDVPFYSMVYHGSVNYTGQSINFSSDSKTEFLRTVEYGALLKYTLVYRNHEIIKNSDYNWIYSANFNDNKESLIENYKSIDKLYSKVSNAQLTKHQKLAESVYLTEYSNGVKTIVNYSNSEHNCEYGKILPKDFIIID